MRKFTGLPNSPSDEYHLESSNKLVSMEMPASHQINYDTRIHELVKNAPVKIAGPAAVEPGLIDLLLDTAPVSLSVETAITSRVSGRIFSREKGLSLSQLSKLLYLANGVRKDEHLPDRPIYSRNVPCSGGIGSVEVYCFVLNVEGVEAGIYHFDSLGNRLECLKTGNFATWLKQFAFYQAESAEPAVVFVLTANIGTLKSKYGERGYRLGLLDTGHVSQNIYLVATALGLNVFAFGGFVDEEINRALDLDGLDRCTLLCLSVGSQP